MSHWLLLSLFLFRICHAHIPETFHIWHDQDTDYSKEEISALKSWQERHPKWQFKIWTDSDFLLPPFSKAKICRLKRFPSLAFIKKEDLKRAVLNQEGGVWIHPDLICCKPINHLVASQNFFISQDKTSILGSEARHPLLWVQESELPEQVVLPDSFIFPDQIFTTQVSEHPSKGVCFWKFKGHLPLNEEFKKIQSTHYLEAIQETSLLTKLSTIKIIEVIALLLTLLNGVLLTLSFSYIYPHLKYFLGAALVGLFIFFNPFTFSRKTHDWNTENLYATHPPENDKYLRKTDVNLLRTYQTRYSKHFASLDSVGDELLIPPIIHVIWGGENPFPQKSIANMASWIRFHPTWVFKFWTDDPSRPTPIEGMEKHLFSALSSPHIEKYLPLAENWGERSDLLRYEILFQEGGLYVDHDIECFRSFDSLHSHFDFYASLEPLHQSPLRDSYVTLANCLIGSRAEHPILEQAMHESRERWNYYARLFPDKDKQSTLLKTIGRTFDSFDSAFHHSWTDKCFLLPSLFTFPDHFPSELTAPFRSKNLIFCNHQWDNAWLETFSPSTTKNIPSSISNKIRSLHKQSAKLLKTNIAIFLGLSVAWSLYFVRSRKTKKRLINV